MRPQARYVTGSYHFLGLGGALVSGLPFDPLAFINEPISCHTNVIPVVCSAVQEAEYAGLFAAARIADDERRILHNLGYPQPPTLRLCDNKCAVGFANKTMIPRLSKSIDMCFHWLQDRIQQCQFRAQHVAGNQNVSDYFTKALPRCKHDQYAMPHTAYVILSMIPLHHLYYTFASYTILYVSYILLFYFVN